MFAVYIHVVPSSLSSHNLLNEIDVMARGEVTSEAGGSSFYLKTVDRSFMTKVQGIGIESI